MKQLLSTITFAIITTGAMAQSPAIHVTQQGSGAPVLLLPGFVSPASVWNETIAHLTGEYEYHRVSYAGFNGLAPIDTPWYQSIKRELLTYIRDHDLRQVHLIGHSMGGNLAVEVAAELPDRVRTLTLVDALPCMREVMMPGVAAEYIRYDNPHSEQLLRASDEAMRQNAQMMAQSMTSHAAHVDTLVRWMMQADRKTYVYGYVDLLKLDLRPPLAKITVPTLILGAPFPSASAARNTLEQQYATLGQRSIRIAPESKHFIMFDQPEWFYEQVNTKLSQYE